MSHQKYQRIARLYDILDLPFEHGRYRPMRGEMFKGLSGRILDAGVGTGRNMRHYPIGADMVGIDISPAMLARADSRRLTSGARVDLHEMDITATTFPGSEFDAVVATFLFCVLDDELQLPALKEIGRILKPGGEAHILEYAYSANAWQRFVMRLWAPWVYWAYGARFDRHTEQYVAAAGLEVIEVRFLFRDIIKLIRVRHIT